MSTIEEMLSRHRELEQIAINAPDATTRKRATEERINLSLLIQKDNQNATEKQNARIADDKEHTAKVDEVLAALAEADNAYSQIPTSDRQRRDNQMTKILSLRLRLQNLQTFTGGV
jgi:hypothetical protein